MVNVCIQKDLFPAGESLFEILTMRMASVQWREANAPAAKADASNAGAASQPIDAFLCSADFAEKQGGMAAIVEMTRSMRAKKLMLSVPVPRFRHPENPVRRQSAHHGPDGLPQPARTAIFHECNALSSDPRQWLTVPE